MEDLTLTGMEADVAALLTAAHRSAAGRPVLVAAASLMARAAVRALSESPLADGLLLLMPVTDVERTIARVVGFDPVAQWRSGPVTDPERTYRVVAHGIKYAFARDVVDHGWSGVSAARDESARVAAPVFALAAERDDWVLPDAVAGALSAPAAFPRDMATLAGSGHDVARDHFVFPTAAEVGLAYARRMASGGARADRVALVRADPRDRRERAAMDRCRARAGQ